MRLPSAFFARRCGLLPDGDVPGVVEAEADGVAVELQLQRVLPLRQRAGDDAEALDPDRADRVDVRGVFHRLVVEQRLVEELRVAGARSSPSRWMASSKTGAYGISGPVKFCRP